MLDELHVSNIALIEDASLEFSEGLTVLTGETGAGKTALLAALKLICGARADANAVRDGADEAIAEARIIDEDEFIVRRRLNSSGRSRCSIDGSMVSVGELADATSSIEVHGQHEQVLLLGPTVQLSYLDSWAGIGPYLDDYSNARNDYRTAEIELHALLEANDKDTRELEFMRYTCEQIGSVDPVRGEYEQLEEELPRLQHADELNTAMMSALSALHDDGSAIDLIARASASLSHCDGVDPELDVLAERLEEQLRDMEELSRDLNAYARSIDTDPYRLEEVLDRLDALSKLMERFGPTMDDVFANWEHAKQALSASESSPLLMEEAKKRCERARREYVRASEALSGKRRAAAIEFCSLLEASVAELAMQDSGFEFEFEELPFDEWTDQGPERIELMFRSSQAAKSRPLRRIASGGELSRILLALECMHYEHGPVRDTRVTIVFDEVDSGIGGATANAVARKLKELSSSAQVIVVTHLAQVAALADVQYVVQKRQNDGSLPSTDVVKVEGEARVAEIARMLSGDTGGTALEHARALLAETEVQG